MYADGDTDGEWMTKAASTGRKAPNSHGRGAGRRAGWVRKNIIIDQRKLDVARRALGVDTDTEAIDRALEFVVPRRARERVHGCTSKWRC